MLRSRGKLNQVRIAELKAHLGQYLKLVKSGEEVIILDRQTPVAKIVSFSSQFDLSSESTAPSKTWKTVMAELSATDEVMKPKRLNKSVQTYLQEDRGNR